MGINLPASDPPIFGSWETCLVGDAIWTAVKGRRYAMLGGEKRDAMMLAEGVGVVPACRRSAA